MLGKLFGKKKEAAKGKTTPQLSSAIENAIIGVIGAQSIPPMPGAAQKAFQLATDPNAEAHDFIDVIESDEALAARVLKIANSVFFERGKRSSTIEDAVGVIGLNELRCLMNASGLSELFPSTHPLRPMLWANDISTALISRALAGRFLAGKEDLLFLGGLMHDLGKLLLLQRVPDLYGQIIEIVKEKGRLFIEAEIERFPFNHCEVGQLIGARWRFSEELIEIIRSHHEPWPTTSPGPTERTAAYLVKSADCISHALGIGHLKGFLPLQKRNEEELTAVWNYLGVPIAETRDYVQSLKRTVEMELDLYSGKGI